MTPRFVHLHLHSEYSLTDSSIRIPELVEHGETGWLVPPGSADALVDAMRDFLTAPVAELERMGRNGAERVALHHDATREAARLASLFRMAMRAKG